jgi:hypothetical protein
LSSIPKRQTKSMVTSEMWWRYVRWAVWSSLYFNCWCKFGVLDLIRQIRSSWLNPVCLIGLCTGILGMEISVCMNELVLHLSFSLWELEGFAPLQHLLPNKERV